MAEKDTKEELEQNPFAASGNTQVRIEDDERKAVAEHTDGKKRQRTNGMKQTPSHMLEQLDKTI